MPGEFDDLPGAAKTADPFSDLPDSQPSPFDDLPDSSETVAKRIDSDVFYNPTLDEFKAYNEFKASEPSRPWEAFKRGASGLLKSAGELVAGLATSGYKGRTLGDAVQSFVEASGRGTVDLAIGFRPLADKISRLAQDYNEEQFLTAKAQQEALKDPNFASTKAQRDQWSNEFKDYKANRDYERFKVLREMQQIRETARQGKGDIVDHTFGTPNQKIAEGGAPFADPTTVATMGASSGISKVTAGIARGATSKALQAGGKVATQTGKAVVGAASLPERMIGGAIKTVAPEVGEKVEKAIAKGQTGVAVAGLGGVSIPVVTKAAQGLKVAKMAGGAVKGAGEIAEAAGRATASPSRFGALARVATDSAAPHWLRQAASRAVILDPVFKEVSGLAADVGRGAASGAIVGGAFGGITQGSIEGIAQGAGSGTVAGAIKGAIPSRGNRVRRSIEEKTSDIANFLSRRTPSEVDAIWRMKLDENQMLRFVDIEAQGRSVTPEGKRGDIQLRFLTADEFAAAHPRAKTLSAVPFESNVVNINTGYTGKRSLMADINRAIEIQRRKKVKTGKTGG